MTQKHVIILNGPPESGKDTLARQMVLVGLADYHDEFKRKIFEIAEAVLGTSKYLKFRRLNACRSTKETSQDFLGGLSPRGFQIKISEDWVKPLLGQRFFGEAAEKGLSGTRIVFSDGGFPMEIDVMREAGHKVTIFKLLKEGCDWGDDSRDYLEDGHWIEVIDGDIEGTLHQIAMRLEEHD